MIGYLWVQPTGKGICGFDKKKLSIHVDDLNPEFRVQFAQLSKEVNNQPLILHRVTVICAPSKEIERCGKSQMLHY